MLEEPYHRILCEPHPSAQLTPKAFVGLERAQFQRAFNTESSVGGDRNYDTAEWVAGRRVRDYTPAKTGIASRASIDRRAALVSFCETCGSGIVLATIEVPALMGPPPVAGG
jgi:hypothetical protein